MACRDETRPYPRLIAELTLTLALLAVPVAALAQDEERFVDRFLFAGEISGSFANEDPGYFNQLEYVSNTLRLLGLSFRTEFRAWNELSVLAEVRAYDFDRVDLFALYARWRPWRERILDVQIGRIPPVFGAYARRQYNDNNPLIGFPLVYQYPTNVRADAAPADLEELRGMRGRGGRAFYTVGDPAVDWGLPVANPLSWDTGLEVRVGDRPLELGIAVTQGSISNPRVRDNDGHKQLAGRLQYVPTMGLVLGLSGARGRYDARELQDALDQRGDSQPLHQTAVGADLEFSRGHWIVRAESIWSRWNRPIMTGDFSSFGGFVEARYKVLPGLYLAGRLDRLAFSRVGDEGERFTWDAPVWRVESGVGYYWRRNVLTKIAVQHNERDGGIFDSKTTFLAVQAVLWF